MVQGAGSLPLTGEMQIEFPVLGFNSSLAPAIVGIWERKQWAKNIFVSLLSNKNKFVFIQFLN